MQSIKMEIEYSDRFRKQYHKTNEKIKTAFRKRLKLFEKNHHHPLLKNHALTGNYKGFQSINITGDWRVIYSERDGLIIFEALGTHGQLYK